MTLPINLPSVDPGEDPHRFVRELLSRYFAPGWIDRIIRTWVPVGIGYLLSWLALNFGWLGLPEKPSATFTLTAGAVVTAVYYALASWAEKRWPRLGRWLIALSLTKQQPVYVPPPAQQAVQDVADGDVLRRSMS
jgi:hypothetical protein